MLRALWAAVLLCAVCGAAQSLVVTPEVVAHNDFVTVAWKDVALPVETDMIAAFAGSNFEKPVLARRVSDSQGWQSGSGQLVFRLVNMRTTYEFRYVRFPSAAAAGQDSRSQLVNADSTQQWALAVPFARSNTVRFATPTAPTQGHLSFSGSPTDSIVVQWTSGTNGQPFVNFGTLSGQLNTTVAGTSTTYAITDLCNAPANQPQNFVDPGWLHTVRLVGLQPNTTYFYEFGSQADGWSTQYKFTTAYPVAPEQGVTLLAFGDMGVAPDQPFAQPVSANMVKEVLNGGIDMALHIGDISYARGHAAIWEWFFTEIEPISTAVPYIVSIGNHEYDYYLQPWHPLWSNFGNDSGGECGVPFTKRFNTPATGTNTWYSFEIGNIHFTIFSGEHKWLENSDQYNFLLNDLASVNRTRTPWLIFGGHRPYYQTLDDAEEDPLRKQLRSTIEPLLSKFKVDLAIFGHQHYYDRTCKMFNYQCDEQNGVVNAVIGMAGNDYQEKWKAQPSWSIFRSKDFGYSKIRSHNSTALQVQFFGKNGTALLDEFWLHH